MNKLIKLIVPVVWTITILFLLYLPKLTNFIFATDKSIHLISYTNLVSPEKIKEFKNKTGIDVRITYFQSPDELFAKLKLSKEEYDLLIVTDYAVELLIKNNMLQKLDTNKIKNFSKLNNKILNRYFDPGNNFSIPFSWSLFGLGVNKEFFNNNVPETLDLVFSNPKLKKYSQQEFKISSTGDAKELIFLASIYLFGKGFNLSPQELESVKTLLIRQKGWIESYSSDKLDYELAAGVVPVVIGELSYINRLLRLSEKFDFIVPQEGTLMTIENLVIPVVCKKTDAVYKFIDFLLSDDVSGYHAQKYGYNPANSSALLYQGSKKNYNLMPKNTDTLHNDLSPKQIEELWLSVQAS